MKKPRKRDKRKKKKQSEQSTSKFDFTEEEHSQFSRRYENGYDLPDIRYEKWKKYSLLKKYFQTLQHVNPVVETSVSVKWMRIVSDTA